MIGRRGRHEGRSSRISGGLGPHGPGRSHSSKPIVHLSADVVRPQGNQDDPRRRLLLHWGPRTESFP